MSTIAVRPVRTARTLKWLAPIAGIMLSGVVVAHASYSAFSATTVNPASNWTAGTVELSDDDSNTALFTVTKLKPGQSGSKCIAVTSSGNLASDVKLYGTGASATKSLDSNIDLKITQGTGAAFGSCSGFTALGSGATVFDGTVAGFAVSHSSFGTGAGTWAPTGSGSETRVFKFEYAFSSSAPNSTQGGTAAVGFTWEAQNS